MGITAAAMSLAKPRGSVIRHADAGDSEVLAQLIDEPVLALGGKPRDGSGIALVELADANLDTLIADAHEGPQGLLQLRWGRPPPSAHWTRNSVELRRHYVRYRHRGQGVARRLLDGAVGLARARQAAWIWLKVDRDSQQAVRFYQQHGFRFGGTSLFMEVGRERTQWVMYREIAERPARTVQVATGR